MQLGFSLDVSRCSGCMACVVACQDQNDLPEDAKSFRHVTRLEQGRFPDVSISFVSVACLHCGDAPCLMVCPTKALFKREQDGVVDVNVDLCVGCHSCALACPFGAPRFPWGEKMAKCDFCIERVLHGLEPACVRACPTRALSFGPVDDLTVAKAEKAGATLLRSFLSTSGTER